MTRGLVIACFLLAGTAGALAQDVAAGEIRSRSACRATASAKARRKGRTRTQRARGAQLGLGEDYNYSDANKNSGITWDEAVFKEYITNPRAKIPGTKMVFAGISSEKERNNLWAYLKQFDAAGKKK